MESKKGAVLKMVRNKKPILGGQWDLVATYNWAYNPTYPPPKWAYRGYPNYKYGYWPSYKQLLSPMGPQVWGCMLVRGSLLFQFSNKQTPEP